jgi:hypothetical protein
MKKDLETETLRHAKILKFFCLSTNATLTFGQTLKENSSSISKVHFFVNPLFLSAFSLLINRI